jgi:hypothetical protein
MADFRTLPVLEDSGSEQVKRLNDSYNALLDSLGTFMDSLAAATADATVIACATAFLAEVETDAALVVRVGREPGVPVRPARAVTS